MSAANNSFREYYKIAIVGQTGNGKTYGARTLDPDTTGFINIENKPLPFKNTFKYHARPQNAASVMAALKDYGDNPDITLIVIDSFSAFVEMLLGEARQSKRGFDVWNLYNEEIGKFLNLVKLIKKEIIVIAHDETLNIEGAPEKRIKVKGKEWEGLIEKEFTIVLYAEKKFTDKKPNYNLLLVGEGMSAKCPPDIFGKDVIKVPNDYKEIHKAIINFV